MERAYPMTRIIDQGIDFTQFESDYRYSAHFDVVFVQIGSRLYTWINLH
jgi:hypothetical protein